MAMLGLHFIFRVFIAVVCVMLLIGSSYDIISTNITRMFKAPAEPPVVDPNSDDVQLLSSSNVQEDGTETCVASTENTSEKTCKIFKNFIVIYIVYVYL